MTATARSALGRGLFAVIPIALSLLALYLLGCAPTSTRASSACQTPNCGSASPEPWSSRAVAPPRRGQARGAASNRAGLERHPQAAGAR